jgi:hypothetical protein
MPVGVYKRTAAMPPETRAKLSIAMKGKQNCLGCHRSEETRAKMSATMRGRPKSLEERAHMSEAHKGWVNSPETRAKMSAAQMGRKAWNKGVSPTVEVRIKLSMANWKGGPRISRPKSEAKRRGLGHACLNSWFIGCVGHHINKNDVIYIPGEMHKSVSHNVWTGRNMEKINALAGAYLTEDWT